MKKCLLIAALSACLLTGCGTGENTSAPELPEPPIPTQETQTTGLSIGLEHEAYDPSMKALTYLIYNESNIPVCFGEEYFLEQKTASGWEPLPFREDTGFIAIGYSLKPGETMALTCHLPLLQGKPESGEYRLVKTVTPEGEGQQPITLYAPFSLGESPYSEETPYGITPMEQLPEHYGAADGARDGTVTFTDQGLHRGEDITTWLQKVSMNIPCQMRTVQEFNEGTPMVTDVLYEDDKFCWKVRSGGGIYQKFFSYLVTDGTRLYLSNGADWETAEAFENELAGLIPSGAETPEKSIALVQEMTEQRLADNVKRYQTWSPDGRTCAAWNAERNELLVSRDGRGGTFPVNHEDGAAAEIRSLVWEEDGMLLVYTDSRAHLFDPDAWILH